MQVLLVHGLGGADKRKSSILQAMDGMTLMNPIELLTATQQPCTGHPLSSSAPQPASDNNGILSSLSSVDLAPLEWPELNSSTCSYSSALIPAPGRQASYVRGLQAPGVPLAALLSAPGLVLHRHPPPTHPTQPAPRDNCGPPATHHAVAVTQVPHTAADPAVAPAEHAPVPDPACHGQQLVNPTAGLSELGSSLLQPSSGWVSRNPGPPLHHEHHLPPHQPHTSHPVQQAAGQSLTHQGQHTEEDVMVEDGHQAEQEDQDQDQGGGEGDSMSEDLTGRVWDW
jgi:hypothetical protein